MPRLQSVTVVILALLFLASDRADAQFRKGLTQQTTMVKLNRKRPPKVYLMGTAIKVDGTAQSPQHGQTAARAATMLEAELTKNDPRLRPVNDEAETIITFTIGRLDNSRTTESRQVKVYKKVGTKTVYNEKTKKNEQEDVFDNVNETQSFVVVKGNLSAVLQVRDGKTGAVLDSDTIGPSFDKEFRDGVGAPDSGTVEQQLIQRAVSIIVPRLTPTREAINILLARPNDQIDEINKLGEAGLWTRMLERLELTKPLSDIKKEAYRLYNLGVANEALAYEAEDLATSRKLLDQASSYYSKSIEAKPDEKYFREPQTRISEGITAYAKLDGQQAEYARALATATAVKEATVARAATVEASANSRSPVEPAAFTNADVIELVKAGLDHQNLLVSINEAKVVQFNLETEGLKTLLANKVPNTIIAAMRAKQSGSSAPAPATRKPASVGRTAAAPPAAKPSAPPTAAPAKPAGTSAPGSAAKPAKK